MHLLVPGLSVIAEGTREIDCSSALQEKLSSTNCTWDFNYFCLLASESETLVQSACHHHSSKIFAL